MYQRSCFSSCCTREESLSWHFRSPHDPDDAQALLLSKEQKATTLFSIMNLLSQAEFEEDASSKTFIAIMGLISAYSSVLYFPSALLAGKRYADMLPNTDWLFIWVGSVSSSLTNAIFNWSAYCDMGHQYTSFFSWLEDGYLAWKNSPFRQIVNLCTGAGSILPFWYICLGSNMLWNLVLTTSALANIPVFYSGSEKFYEVMAYSETQWFVLQCQLFFACLVCADTDELKKSIELTKIKTLLVTHWLDLADDFTLASSDQKNAFIALFDNNKSEKERWNAFLNVEPSILPHHFNIIRNSYWLLFMKYIVLGAFGMIQNFGHIVESYRAGASYHWLLGLVFAFCNFLPSIGFTVKGILGFGLVELCVEFFLNPKCSINVFSTHSFFLFLFSVLARVSYFFSGLSGDEINYQCALFIGAPMWLAFLIGLMADIGTAFVFNGPQCEVMLGEHLQAKPVTHDEKKQKAFELELNRSIDRVRTLPLDAVESFVRNESLRKTLMTFFQNKKFISTIIPQSSLGNNSV